MSVAEIWNDSNFDEKPFDEMIPLTFYHYYRFNYKIDYDLIKILLSFGMNMNLEDLTGNVYNIEPVDFNFYPLKFLNVQKITKLQNISFKFH